MNILLCGEPCWFRFSAEHGGNAVKGGGHPADTSVPLEEAIEDALGRSVFGHAKTAGTGDPGIPGSRTNPVRPEHQRRPGVPQPQISRQEISDLAYRYWEDEGRPEGKSDEHWRRAEAALRAESEYLLG